MMAKPIKTIEIHYPMIQFHIMGMNGTTLTTSNQSQRGIIFWPIRFNSRTKTIGITDVNFTATACFALMTGSLGVKVFTFH